MSAPGRSQARIPQRAALQGSPVSAPVRPVSATAVSTPPLHRHQLAWLAAGGWDELRRAPWDAQARACLDHWAARRLPLVITQQGRVAAPPDEVIAMGLPAPRRWQRRRLALAVRRRDVLYLDEFAHGPALHKLLPDAAQAPWLALCAALRACGAAPRVHGSYGWQHLTRLSYLQPESDLDLCIAVADASHADAVAALLQDWHVPALRLDGELVFDGGRAVAWREWLAWRSGRVRAVLVKDLHASWLSADPASGAPLQQAAA